ncbi:hypothetical protein BC938DRAFT_482072 [Jimgerdemannia flammicorona]|uniref:Uncharacterized protein n=1 Tax=Jimgerdemannia flammicorona TaxID=994334 RepID=A0A433QFA3_9FUNG|nr:hypothetical protein BC938DRAFT_482072 [Jimgerdemannia flammicorona]
MSAPHTAFTDGGASDFSGTRNIEDFLEFVEKASGSALTAIGGGDLTRIEKEKEIFFVYVYDNLTPEENMRTISNTARAFINQVPFYTTSDPIVAKSLGVVTPPAALILKDGRQHTYPAASFLFEDRLILKAWVKKEKFPALVGLTADNSEEILRGDRLVILSVLDTSKPQPFATQKELMKEAALKWKEIEEKEKRKAAVKNRKEVQFAWLDGVKWESYVKRVYGIRAKNLPALVITKPQDDEYFVRDRNNELLNLESDLIQAIIDAESGVLVPESTLSFPQRVVKAFVSFTIDTKDLAVNHWVWSAAVVVAGLAAMWRLSKPAIVTGAQRLQPSLGKVDGHRD